MHPRRRRHELVQQRAAIFYEILGGRILSIYITLFYDENGSVFLRGYNFMNNKSYP